MDQPLTAYTQSFGETLSATKAYPVIVDSLQPVLSPARFVGGKADIAVKVHTRMHLSYAIDHPSKQA